MKLFRIILLAFMLAFATQVAAASSYDQCCPEIDCPIMQCADMGCATSAGQAFLAPAVRQAPAPCSSHSVENINIDIHAIPGEVWTPPD
jgi:hypothetical protein